MTKTTRDLSNFGYKNRWIFTILIFCSLLMNWGMAHASRFTNQFVEFELPPQWNCTLEGAEWVCQNQNDAKKRDAIIVLAAKIKGDLDSLDQYRSYLGAPKSYTSVQGKPVKSDRKYAKDVNLSGQPWIDALHLESEIPGFYTRYLATVKQDIGVLVTYSVNQKKFQDYLKDFDAMVNTLKVFRKSGGINTAPAGGMTAGNIANPPSVSEQSVFGNVNPLLDNKTPKPLPKDELPMLPILIGVAVVAFIIWKKRKNREE